MQSFLFTTVQSLQLLLSTRTFPENWFVLSMFLYSTVKKMLAVTDKLLPRVAKSITSDSNSLLLWTHFFQLSIQFITSPSLALENFTESRQKLIKDG